MRGPRAILTGAFLLTACAVPQAVRAPCSLVLRLSPAEGVRGTQALSHRWQARDIYRYRLSLEVWDGAFFSEISPPLVLPGPSPRARYTNLKEGKYRIRVLAEGNPGGTAPDFVLNALNPCLAVFDFGSGQDVENFQERSAPIVLDAVPFSGKAALLPLNTPAWAKSFKVQLTDLDAGAVRYTGSYPVTQRLALVNLRSGIHYQVLLTASDKKGFRTVPRVKPLFFDSSGGDLEQERTLRIDF